MTLGLLVTMGHPGIRAFPRWTRNGSSPPGSGAGPAARTLSSCGGWDEVTGWLGWDGDGGVDGNYVHIITMKYRDCVGYQARNMGINHEIYGLYVGYQA